MHDVPTFLVSIIYWRKTLPLNMAFYLLMIFLLTFILTGCLRRYALSRRVLDIPNTRSAHSVPIPRGGGVAFVMGVLVMVPYLEGAHFLTQGGGVALVSAGVFIATLGFLDDHGHIPSIWRLLGHIVAAVFALYWLGGIPPMVFGSITIEPSIWAQVFALCYLVWFINLYNFMDGINGLAGVEALSACMSMSGLYWFLGQEGLMVVPLVLAAGVLGFLCWNFPAARIFMGDAGSGFLGFIFGVLSLQAAYVSPLFFWSWLIVLGVFIVDATLTLCVRAMRREKIYEAHSTHAYQHAARYFKSHTPVTLMVLLINLLWLMPIAWCVALGKLNPICGISLAYAPLLSAAIFFRAGRPS